MQLLSSPSIPLSARAEEQRQLKAAKCEVLDKQSALDAAHQAVVQREGAAGAKASEVGNKLEAASLREKAATEASLAAEQVCVVCMFVLECMMTHAGVCTWASRCVNGP